MQRFFSQWFECAFHQEDMQNSFVRFGVKNVIRHDKTQLHVLIDTRITGEAMPHTRETYCVDCGTYIDSVPREIHNALEATRSASSNRDEELANRVLKDTTVTKRQVDLATWLMLISRLSDGNYEQSAIVQLCHQLHSFRSESNPCISTINQTLSLRVVDPIEDDGVWAIIDEECNSCCHGEVWQQNAEAKMKVFGPTPYLAVKEGNCFFFLFFQWCWTEHDEWKS